MATRERQAVLSSRRSRLSNVSQRPTPRPPVEPPVPFLRRPMTLTLAVLDEIAASLAREGIRVGGALARRHTAAVHVDPKAPSPQPDSGTDFVGRFEVPTTDNEGNPFPAALLVSLMRDLYDRMSGASFLEVAGIWRGDDGTFFVDLSIAVEVWTNDRARLIEFIERVRRLLGQKAIALRIYRPEFVWINEPEADAS